MRPAIYIICILTVILAGCESLPLGLYPPTVSPFPAGSQATPAPSRTSPVSTIIPTTAPSGPIRLIVWLPPFLSPSSESPSAELLKKRLQEFEASYQDLVIEIRIKAVYGTGGLLDSLNSASAAAPAALPDLVALPREIEETAAVKGLLLPLDELTASFSDTDWYPYALELAHIQNNVYGFPFAGDALVQVYRTDLITETLTSWPAWVGAPHNLLFPASSENALVTMAFYQANGGLFLDEQGRPQLDSSELSDVLDFYQQALQEGIFSADLLVQLQNDQASWDAFQSEQGHSVITWVSRYLQEHSEQIALTHIPTPKGEPHALAKGWVWSIAGRDEEKQDIAVRLAEYLTDSHFLADWSLRAGYLPTRQSSLSLWSNPELAGSVEQIALAAALLPPTDVLSVVQTPLQQATIAVLRGQYSPLEAAQAASASISGP